MVDYFFLVFKSNVSYFSNISKTNNKHTKIIIIYLLQIVLFILNKFKL